MQSALPPRPRRPAPGRKGLSRPSEAGGVPVRLLRAPLGPPRPAFGPCCSGPDVDPAPPPTALRFRTGRLLADSLSPAGLALLLRSSDHTSLRCVRLPERALRLAAPACDGGGSCAERRTPIAQMERGGTPSKTELACWSGGWEAGPYALRSSFIGWTLDPAGPLTCAVRARS